MSINFQPIGIIHSPFQNLEDMPIQPTSQSSQPGVVEIYSAYAEGLKDLDGFSHVYLIYHLHQAPPYKLTVTPFLDVQQRGLFATRAPCRPNPIGLSLVGLDRIEESKLYIACLDVLDQTPLLDIKPYIPAFEPHHQVRIGWVEQVQDEVHMCRSDERFT